MSNVEQEKHALTKMVALILAFFLVVSVALNFWQWLMLYSILTSENMGHARVYGWAKEIWSEEPLANVSILFFLGRFEEIPYFKPSFNVSTDSNGFYEFYIDYRRQKDMKLEVTASKEGYLTFGVYVHSHSLDHVIRLAWNVNFTMIKMEELP